MCHLSDYRVVLVETMGYEKQLTKESITDHKKSTESKMDAWISKKHVKPHFVENKQLSLNFWCLNPSVVFSQLASMAHCVILMSGTLSPLDSLEAELNVQFPLRLEANHVISNTRLLVTTLSHGPNGTRLCATYQHQNTYTFQDEIGAVVVNACRLVPGGVLCFLPSYSLLDKLIQRWEVQQKREFNDALYKSSSPKMACADKHIRSPLQSLNSSMEKYSDTNDDITSSISNVSSPRPRKVLSGSECCADMI
ncbi:unnamed protein product [Schistosoma rodhaini]|nr:unnamed protein product [Schistosoma rodhaini]